MRVSDFGLDLIKAFEGYFAKPYYCPAGVLTQGYGHTRAAGGEPIGGVWSKEKATQVLRDDLARNYEPALARALKRKPTQAQYDALLSMAYNIGSAGFAGSSVCYNFNIGNDKQAVKSFGMWVKGGGKVLPGLVRRRASEALVYQGVKDLDFDGVRDDGEPVYGPMAQEVAPQAPPPPPTQPASPAPASPPPPAPSAPGAPQGFWARFWAALSRRTAK